MRWEKKMVIPEMTYTKYISMYRHMTYDN